MIMSPIVAIEGPCLSGKTTLVGSLSSVLVQHGISATVIPEYVAYVGDQNNQPDRPFKSDMDMVDEALFYVGLEQRRQRDITIALQCSQLDGKRILLLDRTFFTCLAYAQLSGNLIAKRMYEDYLASEGYMLPDLIVFLLVDTCSDEYLRRKERRRIGNPRCRGLSYKIEEFSYIYRADDYERFFKTEVCKRFAKIIFVESLSYSAQQCLDLLFEQGILKEL